MIRGKGSRNGFLNAVVRYLKRKPAAPETFDNIVFHSPYGHLTVADTIFLTILQKREIAKFDSPHDNMKMQAGKKWLWW